MAVKRQTTALYCRLSKDDDLHGDSMSIKNQKILLEKYALEHGYYSYKFYVDDGYSGVSDDRPDFKKMIHDVELGKVNRIIVKDLSRFGRNYIMIGQYVEMMFPKYGVHFISISENMDSEVGNMDMMPFNNLMNEWYARDISKKQRASVRTKGTSGKRLTTRPIYGYVLNGTDWEIDETAAEVIRKIFELYVSGNGINKIIRYLRENQIPTPRSHGNTAEISNDETDYLWSHSTVKNILSKQEYCGDTVNFRTERISYKSKKIKTNSPEEWAVFPDTHPAIISREIFAQAQEIISQKKKVFSERPEYPASPFREIVFCADCGKRMYIMHKNGKHINSDSFVCSTYRKSAKLCSSHYIKEEDLAQLVSDDIRKNVRLLIMDETTFRNNLIHLIKSRNSAEIRNTSNRISEIEDRLNEIPDLRKKLFEEKLSGGISQESFAEIMASLDEESRTLQAERDELLILLKELKSRQTDAELFLIRLKQYTDFEAVNADLTEDLIERIEVCEQDRTVKKCLKKPEIHIFYIGVGNIEELLS